jgi:hypothetical protein
MAEKRRINASFFASLPEEEKAQRTCKDEKPVLCENGIPEY